MGFIFGIINLKGGTVKSEDIHVLGKAVQWDDFESEIEVNSSYGWGYCWHKKRTPKAGIYTNERVAVLCDARIYNSDELKQSFEFELPEEAFAKAYLKWGGTFADKFNGDFAAVIIDLQLQKVLLVRDHIGVRPLTYTIKDDLLIFTSHEFGIAKSNLINNALSEETLVRMFHWHKKQEYSLTVFKYIRKITPGYLTIISPNRISNKKYWIPEKIKTNKNLTFEMAVSHLREHLIKSVKVRMEQGKIGAHVSGGLDSSGVAAILLENIDNKAKIKGYSWSPQLFDEKIEGVNEKEFIMAFSLNKKVEIEYLKYGDHDNLEDFVLPEFEQMPNEIFTMRQASQDDICSLFSGWGGDEFVSLSLRGVMNYFVFRFKLRLIYRWIKIRGVKAAIYCVVKDILPFIVPFGLLESSIYSKLYKLKYFKCGFIFKHFPLFVFNKRKSFYGFGDRRGVSIRLLCNYHLPQRMDSWALFGEKYGIEYKFPLLDKILLEFWLALPARFTYEKLIPRFLYREALKGILTESIRTRPNKDEEVIRKYWNHYDLKIREILEGEPELFFHTPFLYFFKSNEFLNAVDKTEDEIRLHYGMYDIRFFLRYKSLVEKYVVTNPYCMKKQKTNSDSEVL